MGGKAVTLAAEQRDVARGRILRAARVALAQKGLSATVDDVAEEAGVNRRTVFRHFATRDGLFAAAIKEAMQRYSAQLPAVPESGDLRAWLEELLLVWHRLNASNGRVYWELTALEPADLPAELAKTAAERREGHKRGATRVATRLWHARGGAGEPPTWLVDAFAVHLSGFTTQALAGDFGRSPEEVAQVSARVLEAALASALAAGR